MVQFVNPGTAARFICTLDQDQSVIVLRSEPMYRGKVSMATPAACVQMIKEGIPFIIRKQPDQEPEQIEEP